MNYRENIYTSVMNYCEGYNVSCEPLGNTQRL